MSSPFFIAVKWRDRKSLRKLSGLDEAHPRLEIISSVNNNIASSIHVPSDDNCYSIQNKKKDEKKIIK